MLYAPWFSFPIDDRRKSGFLYPFLSTANDNGLEVGIPWYWNIAPNQDATLTPRYFIERGFMGSGEYRLLTERTLSQFEGHYLPGDRKIRRGPLALHPAQQGGIQPAMAGQRPPGAGQ